MGPVTQPDAQGGGAVSARANTEKVPHEVGPRRAGVRPPHTTSVRPKALGCHQFVCKWIATHESQR